MNDTIPFPASRLPRRAGGISTSQGGNMTVPKGVLGALVVVLSMANVGFWVSSVNAREALRPNILWLTAEDMSPHLGVYGDPYATTPQLDKFAETAVRYTHAFATAPVCSPARSTLITGMYATSLGTQRLRL